MAQALSPGAGDSGMTVSPFPVGERLLCCSQESGAFLQAATENGPGLSRGAERTGQPLGQRDRMFRDE